MWRLAQRAGGGKLAVRTQVTVELTINIWCRWTPQWVNQIKAKQGDRPVQCPWQIKESNSFGQQSQGNAGWCIPRQIENYNSVSTDLPKTLHQVIFACFVCSSHAFFTRSRCPFYLFAPASVRFIFWGTNKKREWGRPTNFTSLSFSGRPRIQSSSTGPSHQSRYLQCWVHFSCTSHFTLLLTSYIFEIFFCLSSM